MTAAPQWQARRVCAAYGSHVALNGIAFDLAQGGWLGVIGPNGAGKTTLLHVMAGDHRPVTGALLLDGTEVTAIPRRQRARRIAYVPPALEWPTAMTVGEFVALGRTPYVQGWQRFSELDEAAVACALRMTDLESFTDRSMLALSEGERHRAMIAMGLAQEPETLLLDEPTAHLDIKHAWELMGLIEGLHRAGLTIVMATHDLNIAAAFCQRLLLLVDSQARAAGSPREVLTSEQLSAAYRYPIEVHEAQGRISVVPTRG